MGVILRIAFRNLREHRTKTFIIGGLIALGSLLIILSNSLLDRTQAGVKKNYTENFTGDVYVQGRFDSSLSILFGAMASNNRSKTPLIPDYPAMMGYLESRKDVALAAGQVSTMALFAGSDGETRGGAMLFGIDPGSYSLMFKNLVVKEGAYLESGQEGIMLSSNMVDRMKKADPKFQLNVGDSIVLQGMSAGGFSMGKATLRAIFDFVGESDTNNFIAYADLNTARMITGLTVGGGEEVVISERAKDLLGEASDDDIFGEEELVQDAAVHNAENADALAEIRARPRPEIKGDSGAWHFIMLKLKNPGSSAATIKDLNEYFTKNGIAAQAGSWREASSPFSQTIDALRWVLNVVVFVLVVVAAFIIMNTLVVSVIERTGEIGTMRALGAKKGFIWLMFLAETLMLSLGFGILGSGLSGLVALLLNAMHIPAGNAFFRVLFAGKFLTLGINPLTMCLTMLLVTLVSLLAHLYPVLVALRVQPIRAMQNE